MKFVEKYKRFFYQIKFRNTEEKLKMEKIGKLNRESSFKEVLTGV